MKVFNYDKKTKEFISQSEAIKSPLEEDVYLIPANSTKLNPLDPKDGFAVCFDEENEEWDYIEDNRGKTVYSTKDKQELKVDYLGAIKTGYTFLKPKQFDKWDETCNSWIEDKNLKKQDCLNLLESAFDNKATQIKAIACDKEGSEQYIKSQYEIYENMYKNAKAGYYSEVESTEIITANETAKKLTARMILLINEIRHEFQRLIGAEIEVKTELELFRDTLVSKTDNTALSELHSKLKAM